MARCFFEENEIPLNAFLQINPHLLKNMKRRITTLLFTTLLVTLFSCGGSEEEPLPELSTAKNITSFILSNVTPELAGTIDQSNHTITFTVPNGLDMSSLVPTVAISEKATVSPASGAKINLTNEVIYIVTAEDGTQQEYTVTANVNETVSFTVKPLSSRTIEQGQSIVLEGTNFVNHPNNKLVFINGHNSSKTFELSLEYVSPTSMKVKIPDDALTNVYFLEVYNGYEKVALTDFYSLINHRPVITSVSKLNVTIGEQVTVAGNYFIGIDYSVYLVNGSFKTRVELDSFTKTSFTFKVPVIAYNSYQLLIDASPEDVIHTELVKIVPKADAPQILSLNKTTFTKGETLVITGTNFKKSSLTTHVSLSKDGTAGAGVATSVSADGTQVTYILNQTGTFKVGVECGVYGGPYDYTGTFTFSGYYTTQITVNP